MPESTLLVYHTAHLPQQVDKPNKWESDRYLYPHIAQMNAAGRHVAQMLRYHVLDTEAMALQLPKEAMMADITHPGAGFMMQVCPPPAGTSNQLTKAQHHESSPAHSRATHDINAVCAFRFMPLRSLAALGASVPHANDRKCIAVRPSLVTAS